jgi:hypothetical protein
VAELAAGSANVSERLMRRFVADFEKRGVVECVGPDHWRLTSDWAELLGAVRHDNAIPLSAKELEELLTFCNSGPPKNRQVAA